MSTALPHGFINITYTEPRTAREANPADVLFERIHILQSFWKVHEVNYRVCQHDSDLRRRNLFWRVWSDQRLRQSINTTTLTDLWNACNENIDMTPFDLKFRAASSAPTNVSEEPNVDNLTTTITDSLQITQSSLQHGGTLPEIDGDLIAPINSEHQDFMPRSSLLDSRPKAARTASARSVGGRQPSSAAKPKRPTLSKRKSSHAGMQQTKLFKSPSIASRCADKEQHGTAISVFKLPSASSWEDEPSFEDNQVSGSIPTSAEPAQLIIDRDFRNKFAERVASSTNIFSMEHLKKSGSTVRFADDPSLSPSRTAPDGDPTTSGDVRRDRPLLPHRQSASSVAISEGDDEEEVKSTHLPRTTSHLSFLISKRRSTLGRDSDNLDMSPTVEQGDSSTTLSGDPEDASILAMAHRQGVTKAGGVQVPMQHRLMSNTDSRYSSPEQDLTF